MSTHIVLIRHAETDAASRLCGWFDAPLAPAGQRRVRELLRHPPTRPVPDALFTSTLTRATDVATALGRAWALDARPADWAREIYCGDVDGMPLSDLQRVFPELWARNQEQADDDFAWPGGESYAEFRGRVLAGLKAAASAHAGGRLAIVTHAGVISQVLGIILHRPAGAWAEDRPDPLTATEITWDHGIPTAVLTFNDPNWY